MTIINTTEKQRSPETKNNEIQKFDIKYHEVITKINNIVPDHQSLTYKNNCRDFLSTWLFVVYQEKMEILVFSE